jgi:hypothetical protein
MKTKNIALALTLLALPAVVQAQDYTYAFDSYGGIAITGYTGPGGNVTIPDTIDGYPVTSIGAHAFQFLNVTSVTIPNSVTTIGFAAFASCTSLTSVAIGYSVTSIEYGAFEHCTSLAAITVDTDNSVYSSVDGVLFNISQTTLILCPSGKAGSYTIPNSATDIGSYAFQYCTSLTSVTIPDSVTSIAGYAFAYCTSLGQ